MKKKSLVLSLAVLALVGCENKKDDTKEVEELKQKIEDLETNVKELERTDKSVEVVNNEVTKKYKLLSILEENPNIDPYSIDESVIYQVLNSPETMFDKFISEKAKNSGANEVESARGIIGYALQIRNMQGLEISSVPIYAALQQFIYQQIYKEDSPLMQKATVDVGIENNNLPINNFNILTDSNVASDFKDFKKAYNLQNILDLHEEYRFEEGDPLMNSIINIKGEFGYQQEEYTFPGGVHISFSIGGEDSKHHAYFFYVFTEPANIQKTQNSNLWAVPVGHIDLPTPDFFDPNCDPDVIVDHLKIICLVTGPGFDDF